MDSSESKTLDNDLFTPWNDKHQHEIYQLHSAAKQINNATKKQGFHRKHSIKDKEAIKREPSIEDVAKKTLLDIAHLEKDQAVVSLKKYLANRNQNPKEGEGTDRKQLKLPFIHKEKAYQSKQIERKKLQNSNSFVIPNKIKPDNQEQEIFKKYGEHRKSPSNADRNLGHAGANFSQGAALPSTKRSINEFKNKYETLDVSRQKSEFQPQLKYLNLKGKKYSYDIKYRRQQKQDMSYIPSQPNITPHYVLFGGNKEDVFKKIYQQLQHKFK